MLDPRFGRNEVLSDFNHIQIYLLLGAAILTLAGLSGAFMLLRRRVDPLLLWFSLFTGLYGMHLILDYQLLWSLQLYPEFLRRVLIVLELLVTLPALFFLRALDLLGRFGRIIALTVSSIAVCLAAATAIFGVGLQTVDRLFLAAALLVSAIVLFLKSKLSPDAKLLRSGVLVSLMCGLYDQVTRFVGHYRDVEPFGIVIFMVCLGFVVGRRALANEQTLGLIQQELEIARRIQTSILPAKLPNPTYFRLAARYMPMTSVAGDFYDFILPDDQHVGILVADVSGHGVPAALIASMVKLATAAQTNNAARPAKLLHGMNAVLCGNTQSQFVTAAYAYLSASSGVLSYAAAGHPPMLLMRNGEVFEVTENGLMLGAFSFATYSSISQPLFSGDRLVLYTDGLPEAADVSGEEFGNDRLAALIKETAGMDENEAADLLMHRIKQWAHSQADDLTVVICDYINGTEI